MLLSANFFVGNKDCWEKFAERGGFEPPVPDVTSTTV